MTEKPAPTDIGVSAKPSDASFVMTDRSAHEAWSLLIRKNHIAASVLHFLVAKMGHLNAVVVSQKTLAKMFDVHPKTIQRATAVLVADRWIRVVQLNGSGTVPAYVVNDQVAWGQARDQLYLSVFSATVIADAADQNAETLSGTRLRKIPMLYAGERQLPMGPGEVPPAQTLLPGTEPDLPQLAVAPSGDMDQAVLSLEQAFGKPQGKVGRIKARPKAE